MIRPLDLQTMFMSLDKVSKEAASTKDALAQQQAIQAQKLLKVHDLQGHTVTPLDETTKSGEEESTKVKSDEHRDPSQGQGSSKHTGDSEEDQETAPSEPRRRGWQDPELGQHIDLKG